MNKYTVAHENGRISVDADEYLYSLNVLRFFVYTSKRQRKEVATFNTDYIVGVYHNTSARQ